MIYKALVFIIFTANSAVAQDVGKKPVYTLQITVGMDRETGEMYRPLVGDGNFSKISDPLWMIKDPKEKADAFNVAALEKTQSDETIRTKYLAYHAADPTSCESVYYGLFTDGVSAKDKFDFEGENLSDDFALKQSTYDNYLRAVGGVYSMSPKERADLNKDFAALKKNFMGSFHSEPAILQNERLEGEIQKRVDSAELSLSPNSDSGYIDEITDCRSKDINCARAVQVGVQADGEPLYNTNFGSHVWVGLGIRKLLKVRSPASRVWYLGHELSHASDLASPEVVSCLAQNQDLHRTSKKEIEKIVESTAPTSRNGAGSDVYYGGGTEYARALRRQIMIQKQIDKCKVTKTCSEVEMARLDIDLQNAKKTAQDEESVPRSISLSRFSFLINDSKYRINSLNMAENIIQIPSQPKSLQTDKKTKRAAAKIEKIEKEYVSSPSDEASEYEKSPDIQQYTEAIADYRANIEFAQYIYKKYPNDSGARRKAVLALLFSFKPSPFEGSDLAKMNLVGSKKMNETRVLRGILANEAVRGILGCHFEKERIAPREVPQDCSNPNVLAGYRGRELPTATQNVAASR